MQTIENYISSVTKTNYNIVKWLKRLSGITGFVSVIGDNPRVGIFNRYNHVIRVTRLTHHIASLQSNIDINKCILLALLHDINRLPFAHLLEKRINFHQVDYIKPFFKLMETDFYDDIICDLENILQKSISGSKEASLVFIADCIDGFIEDSLFAFSVFGLNPINVPNSLINILGYNNQENFNGYLDTLKMKFEHNDGFTDSFDEMVFEYSLKFSEIHNFLKLDRIDFNKFHFIRQELKSNLLVSMIFPINNEQVSQGNKLYNKFLLPYIELQRVKSKDFIMDLFQMTDNQMLEDAERKGILKCKKEELYPVLQ